MKFIINGGKKLEGEITARGFKNSATPIIAATLLIDRVCILENIPRIGDVEKLLEILKGIGSKQKWLDEHTLEIQNDDLSPRNLDQDLLGQIRSSILLIGPILARFGELQFAVPGGCKIGSRPIDTHLEAFRDAGAEIEFDEGRGLYSIRLKKLQNREVYLKELSVTATENLLMLGCVHALEIRLAAIEPHVFDLARFLEKLGARIENFNGHSFRIAPPKKINSADSSGPIRHKIINDPIEIGTFAILAAATKSRINIRGFEAEYSEATLRKLKDFGVAFEINGGILTIDGQKSYLRAATVKTFPYPGLPTDLQAPFGVLATQAEGASLIFDTLYEGRLKYIDELKKMGADAVILDPHRALISGPAVLHGARIESLDLRAGATLVIAALIAQGQSELDNIEQIDRGYERLDERLQELGADIKRFN